MLDRASFFGQLVNSSARSFPVEEFFVDSVPGPPNPQSDEERS